MAYLTDYSYRQLIERIDIANLQKIDKQFFIKNIFIYEDFFYFFNQFELKKLLKEKIILSGDKTHILVYKKVSQREDNLNYVLEIKGKVKYHKDNSCVALNRGFKNFFMPEPIVELEDKNPEKHKKLVQEIRNWFELNNFTVDRYTNGEINDNILTTKFNQTFPNKFDIKPISTSHLEKSQFHWYIEKKTIGNIQTEDTFSHNDFLNDLTDLIKSRKLLCNSKTMNNLSKYDFLVSRPNIEIEEYIQESITKGFLKEVNEVFIENYGMTNLKIFWEKHINLKRAAYILISDFFKWTYNFKEKSFDEVFLEDFNLESCSLCYQRNNIMQ